MLIMIVYEIDCVIGDGIGLFIKYMNICVMFDNYNFMKIMMMFRKICLWELGFYCYGCVIRWKKIYIM